MIYIVGYVITGLCLAYILSHQLSIVSLISTKTDLKLRSKVIKKQKQLELYIKMCPVWPFLIIKELYDAYQEKR